MLSGNVTPSFCGQSAGAIDLSASGGQTPYTLLWSNNSNSEDLSSFLAGNYTPTVTCLSGCLFAYHYVGSPAIRANPPDPGNLNAGYYKVTATDALRCTRTATFNINLPVSSVHVACALFFFINPPPPKFSPFSLPVPFRI